MGDPMQGVPEFKTDDTSSSITKNIISAKNYLKREVSLKKKNTNASSPSTSRVQFPTSTSTTSSSESASLKSRATSESKTAPSSRKKTLGTRISKVFSEKEKKTYRDIESRNIESRTRSSSSSGRSESEIAQELTINKFQALEKFVDAQKKLAFLEEGLEAAKDPNIGGNLTQIGKNVAEAKLELEKVQLDYHNVVQEEKNHLDELAKHRELNSDFTSFSVKELNEKRDDLEKEIEKAYNKFSRTGDTFFSVKTSEGDKKTKLQNLNKAQSDYEESLENLLILKRNLQECEKLINRAEEKTSP